MAEAPQLTLMDWIAYDLMREAVVTGKKQPTYKIIARHIGSNSRYGASCDSLRSVLRRLEANGRLLRRKKKPIPGSAQKPWIALGISRGTWYRHQRMKSH